MPWIEYLPTKKSGIPGILGDVEDHLPAKHPYKEPDKVTWTHEGTHGVNAYCRMANNNGGRLNINCFYLLNNRAFMLTEPSFKLSDVAKKTPPSLRERTYASYLIAQAKYWNDDPLYIFDELSAYLNGAKAGIQLGMDERAEYSGSNALDFFGYGAILWDMTGKKDEYKDLFIFLMYEMSFVVRKYPSLRDEYKRLYFLLADVYD